MSLYETDWFQILTAETQPVFTCSINFSNGNSTRIFEICSSYQWRQQKDVINLNGFHTLFWCFYFWLRTSKYRPLSIVSANFTYKRSIGNLLTVEFRILLFLLTLNKLRILFNVVSAVFEHVFCGIIIWFALLLTAN